MGLAKYLCCVYGGKTGEMNCWGLKVASQFFMLKLITIITWFDDDADYHHDDDNEDDDDEPGVTSVCIISTGATIIGLLKISPASHWSHIRSHLGENHADYAMAPLYDENYEDGPPSLPLGLHKAPPGGGNDGKEALSYDVGG